MTNLECLIQCYNLNNFEPIRSRLANDCKYRSQWVFDTMEGRDIIADYLVAKSRAIEKAAAYVTARKGVILAPYSGMECAVMFNQSDDKREPTCLILIGENDSNQIESIDICIPGLFHFEVKE